MKCSQYRVPHPYLQPFFWLSVALEWVDTWGTTMQELSRPSGSPLLKRHLSIVPRKLPLSTCQQPMSKGRSTHSTAFGDEPLLPGE